MNLLTRCACFKCSLSSDRGSYETHSKERRQQQNAIATNIDANERTDTAHEHADQPLRVGTTNEEDMSPSTSKSKKTTTGSTTTTTTAVKVSKKAKKGSGSKNKSSKNDREDDHQGHRLTSFTLEGIAELINEQKINKSSVIVLVGAGMSTVAGVPDFRSPNTGIYANLQKYNLPHPEDVFKIDYFKNNPVPFYDLSRSILPAKLYPTISHYFIRLLHDKGYLLRCFSQNVDCLESLSGLPKDKLCLAHGSFETGHCLRCNAEYSLAWMRGVVETGGIPHCIKTKDCKGLIKPDVKLFGERLDGRFFRLVKEDFPKCELLIIIGSSLTVMPFAQLVQKVPAKCPRLLINKTKSGYDIPVLLRIFRPSDGLMYDRKGNTRDVAHIGNCDDACMQLATLLGWNGELIELARNRREELESEQST